MTDISTFIQDFHEAFGEKATLPILFYYSDTPVSFPEKTNGCMFKLLMKVKEGQDVALSADTVTCVGGKHYAGFAPLPERVYTSLRGSRLSCYKNPVYVIIDESTFSQSEYTALALTSLPNAKSVGRQTSGTDGDISTIWLPGGVLTGLSGVSVLDSDGDPTYRVGLIPDIEIQSTVEELKDGTDAILNHVLRLIE